VVSVWPKVTVSPAAGVVMMELTTISVIGVGGRLLAQKPVDKRELASRNTIGGLHPKIVFGRGAGRDPDVLHPVGRRPSRDDDPRRRIVEMGQCVFSTGGPSAPSKVISLESFASPARSRMSFSRAPFQRALPIAP
jgi:hypothetical protein